MSIDSCLTAPHARAPTRTRRPHARMHARAVRPQDTMTITGVTCAAASDAGGARKRCCYGAGDVPRTLLDLPDDVICDIAPRLLERTDAGSLRASCKCVCCLLARACLRARARVWRYDDV